MPTDDEFRQAEILLRLWDGTKQRAVERRSIEWKVAFGVWAAELGAIALVLNNAAKLRDLQSHWCAFAAVGFIIVVLHSCYVFCFVREHNASDSKIAKAYERSILAIVGPAGPTVAAGPGSSLVPPFFEVSIALALAGLATLVVYSLPGA